VTAAPTRAPDRHPVAVRTRHRSLPLAVTGALLVAGCALAFALAWLRAGDRTPVLALARTVAAGQVITSADLTVAHVSVQGPVTLIPAGQEAAVTGRAAAVGLSAGSLLTAAGLGAPPPPAGQALLGVAVKAGQFPPGLAAGATVDVLATPAEVASGSQPGGGNAGQVALPVGRAVVDAVTAQPGTPGALVVELQVYQDAVPQVVAAASTGQIDLAAVPAGGN
jgi:hypothetical protein